MTVRPTLARWLALVAATVVTAAPVSARAASVYVDGLSFPGSVYPLAVAANGDISVRSPAFYTAHDEPAGIAPTPDGKHLYVVAGNDLGNNPGKIDQFGVSSPGALSPLSPASITTGAYPAAIVVSPNGRTAFTATAMASPDILDEYIVGTGGTLKSASPPSVAADGQDDIVMTPDGRHLYLSTFAASGIIDEYDVNGGLVTNAPADVTTGPFPLGMAVTPDGRSLYVGVDSGGGLVAQFNIGADGKLTAKTPPTVALTSSFYPNSLSVSPNGRNLYVADSTFGHGIAQFAILAGGRLSPMSPADVGTANVGGIVVSPDGKSLYAISSAGATRYAISSTGALAVTSNVVTAFSQFVSIAVSPDQGPRAEFTVTPGSPGRSTVFHGGGSHDPDGKVVRYAWTFGDGKSATTSGPTVAHVYVHAGSFSATLTVTDNAGASTQRVFTGHQVLLNGGPAATVTRKVAVLAKLSALRVTPKRFKVSARAAKVRFRLDTASRVLLLLQRSEMGHRHGKKCTPGPGSGAKCSAFVTLRGSRRIAGRRGANAIRFSGHFAGKVLSPGNYRVVLSAYAGVTYGAAVTFRFTILG